MRPTLLITGADGFVGRALVESLLPDDRYDLHLLKRCEAAPHPSIGNNVVTHVSDLRDATTIRDTIRKLQPHAIIHLAAISPVSYSHLHDCEVVENNLIGTINLVRACRDYVPKLQHFLYAGTVEEYGATNDRPASELTLCRPNSPYSLSKFAGTQYVQYMQMAYGFPATILRATNTYGRRNNANYFIESVISQILRNPSGVITVGATHVTRDFMYIDDHVAAYLSVLDKPAKSIGEVFNFSTGDARRLKDVVTLIIGLTGFQGEVAENRISLRPLEIIDGSTSPKKALKVLGWRANWKLERGIQQTIRYWRGRTRL